MKIQIIIAFLLCLSINCYLENGNKFDVEFVLDGGTCTETLPEFYYELTGANLPAASTMSKEGYTFVGWFDNANGIGEAMTAIVGGTKGNLQIYAIWKSNASLEVALNASDVAVLNTVTPTIVVVPTAPIAKVKLTGTELDSKYATTKDY